MSTAVDELVIQRSLNVDMLDTIGDGWTVYGRAVPYGVPQRVSDDGHAYYLEQFERGAFRNSAKTNGRGVRFLAGHDRDIDVSLLGRCVEVREESDGLYTAFRIFRDHPLAEQARSGELTKWSVGALVKTSQKTAGVVLRTWCVLDHVAATPSPQYAGAGVLYTREAVMPRQTPMLDAARARLDALRRGRDHG